MTKTINKITRDDVQCFSEAAQIQEFNGKNALNEYQRIATKSAIYPGQGTPLGLVYTALKGAGEAGEFAEHVGKAMRDDGFGPKTEINTRNSTSGIRRSVSYEVGCDTLTPERRTALIKEIGDQLWYLAAKCNELGTTLSDVALVNLEKLCDRGERDKLRGSGDER